MIRRVITQEVVEIAAGNEGWGDQFMTVLLDQLTDEVCKSISPKVVEAAAGNQAHGEQIMTILLNRLKYEVCRSISEEVAKVAAGNRRYGAQIMEKLLKFCGDVVCEDFSFAAACTAAENGKSGAPILDLLLQADEEKVSKLMLEVYSRAEEGGGGWLKEILPKLGKRPKKICKNRIILATPSRQIGAQLFERSPAQLSS